MRVERTACTRVEWTACFLCAVVSLGEEAVHVHGRWTMKKEVLHG
jgi:hypothetical protein